MGNQATTSYETINTSFPPNMETNYDDDAPLPLVRYENNSSDDESNDVVNLPLEWIPAQINELVTMRQQMYALQQQIDASPCQQQPRKPLQKLDGNNYRNGDNNNSMMGSQQKGGQQQDY